MKNRVIPTKEFEAVKKCLAEVNNLIDTHEALTPNLDEVTSVERMHAVLYLDIVGDFLKSAKTLEGFLETSESEFIEIVTDGGKKSIREAELDVMMSGLLNTLKH